MYFNFIVMLSLSLHYNLLKEENRYWFINYFEAFTFYISIMCFVCKLVCFLSTLLDCLCEFGKKNIRILGKAKNNREHPIVLWKTLDLDSENLDPRPGFLLETRRLNQISLFFSYHCTGALGMSIANPSYHLKWICE